jgi:hypothetical protein
VRLLSGPDASDCHLVLAADSRRTPPVWTGLTVLDDSDAALADEQAHKRRWRAWLYWSNVLQFLEHGGGDSAQLTTSLIDGFATEVLTMTGGAGWLTSTRTPVPTEEPTSGITAAPPAPAAGSGEDASAKRAAPEGPADAASDRDPGWDRVIEYLDPEETGLAELAHALADAGVPAPQDGYELDEHGWQAELAWPNARIGVVLAPRTDSDDPEDEPDHEAEDRDSAFAATGWDVRTAVTWDRAALIARLTDQDQHSHTTSDGEPKR